MSQKSITKCDNNENKLGSTGTLAGLPLVFKTINAIQNSLEPTPIKS